MATWLFWGPIPESKRQGGPKKGGNWLRGKWHTGKTGPWGSVLLQGGPIWELAVHCRLRRLFEDSRVAGERTGSSSRARWLQKPPQPPLFITSRNGALWNLGNTLQSSPASKFRSSPLMIYSYPQKRQGREETQRKGTTLKVWPRRRSWKDRRLG